MEQLENLLSLGSFGSDVDWMSFFSLGCSALGGVRHRFIPLLLSFENPQLSKGKLKIPKQHLSCSSHSLQEVLDLPMLHTEWLDKSFRCLSVCNAVKILCLLWMVSDREVEAADNCFSNQKLEQIWKDSAVVSCITTWGQSCSAIHKLFILLQVRMSVYYSVSVWCPNWVDFPPVLINTTTCFYVFVYK